MASPPPEPIVPPVPRQGNTQIDALLDAATPEDLRRAMRIVLGAEMAYWERDFETGQTWYSPLFFTVLGLPPDEGREQINARIHADDRARFEAVYDEALARGGPFSYDVRFLDVQGRYRWVRSFARVWLDEAGRPRRLIGTIIDVHAERQARLEADEHAQRYRRALEASSEAHFERTAGLDDFVLSGNFARLLGHPPGTPPPDRRGFLALVHPDDLPQLKDATARAWKSGEAWSATYRLRTADGGWRWFRGRGRTERDALGRLRMSGMIGDVHQQELDRQELNRHRRDLRAMVAERTEALHASLAETQAQRVQAERASAAKSEFLAHMSHELRTPLNGLLGLTDLARKSADQPAQLRYLDGALESGRALLQLINELLDLSRLQAGGIEIAQQPVDLPELLGEALRSVMPAARGKVMSLHYDWIGETTQVLADAARVRQVLGSLLSNAVKFTPRGHVSVTGQLVPGPDGAFEATVHVDDTGPGIAPGDQERIFEAFVQGDGSLTRPHGGSGLGLTIARRMARAMGGDVRLAHSGAAGSSFVFSWPVRRVGDGLLAPEPPLAPGRVWLVNGGSTSGPWFARRVARLGWSTKLFDDVDAAVAHAVHAGGAAEPEVVAVSYQALLPDADFAALRRSLPRAHIALLVRPDWDDPEVERAAAAQGALPVVLPLTPRALRSLLRGTRAAQAATPVPAGVCARVLVVEDNAVNLMITEEFVRQLGHEPSGVADGAAALAACSRQPPDLVLMDLQMPVMDGLEATRRLRALQAEGKLPRFPIIGLSAHAAGSDRAQALAAGMDDFLTKPILIDALRRAIEPWARASGAPATP